MHHIPERGFKMIEDIIATTLCLISLVIVFRTYFLIMLFIFFYDGFGIDRKTMAGLWKDGDRLIASQLKRKFKRLNFPKKTE